MLRVLSLALVWLVAVGLIPLNAQLVIQGKLQAAKAKEPNAPKADATILSEAKLDAADPEGLIAYFKQRTLNDDQLAKIRDIIRRMGDESFEERIKASAEAKVFGLGAVGPLRNAAMSETDPEVKFRAMETLKQIEQVPQAAVAAAATRALAKSQHPNALPTLLGFFPLADNPTVEDDIRLAITQLAIRNDQFSPLLLETLKDPVALRRGAAAVAIIEASLDRKALQAEAVAKVVPMLTTETDSEVKFRIAWTVGTKLKNPDAIRALVEVLPGQPRGRVWMVEDLLLQLAGEKAPKIRMGDKVALEKSSKDWREWLAKNTKPEDFEALKYQPKTTGCILVMGVDNGSWGNGKLMEYGPDLRSRWRVPGITSPADVRPLPNGQYEILETNYNRLREIDQRGNQKNMRQLQGQQPGSIQHFENGHKLVAYRNTVVEYDANWKTLNTYTRNNHDILAAGRYQNGPVYVLVQNNPALIKLDDKFKESPNTMKIGNPTYQPKMEMLPNDRVLITEQNEVVEYNLKDGKSVWKVKAGQPTCVQRLPNGNTLVCDQNSRSIREFSPEGEQLWSFNPPDNLQPLRAYRQ